MANRLAKSYVLRVSPAEGEAFTYATHLGSSLSIAREIAAEQFNARVLQGRPIKSVALMLDGQVVDVFDGRWKSDVDRAFDRALWD